jgi:hypothetical protein
MRYLRRQPSGPVAVLVTLALVVVVLCARGGSMFSPGPLNAEGRANVALGGVTSHADLSGNCSACHVAPWSRETMAGRCLNCHTDVRAQLDAHTSMHGRLPDGMHCRACHGEHRGAHAALTDFGQFDHACTAFPLTGKHQAADCRSCHAGNVYQGTPQACVACHAEPKAHKGRFGSNCAQCHSTSTWGGAGFDHDRAAFRLTGRHRAVDCQSCHVDNVFKGTPQTCVACHAEPQMHKGRFGTNCVQCHSTDTWSGGKFDHDRAAFKLTGKHQTTDCKACHLNNVFQGTPQACVSCHAEPKVHMGRFGTHCAECHSTNAWQGARFDHDRAAFKLTGKHPTVDCQACHKNGVYKGTPQACSACHAEPQVHKGKFGTGCAQCHTTSTWTGATFKHRFPINHGRRRNQGANTCATCHKDPDNMQVYTCSDCHRGREPRRGQGRSDFLNIEWCACPRGIDEPTPAAPIARRADWLTLPRSLDVVVPADPPVRRAEPGGPRAPSEVPWRSQRSMCFPDLDLLAPDRVVIRRG